MEPQCKVVCFLFVLLSLAACGEEPTPTPDLMATQAAAAAEARVATPTPTLPPAPTLPATATSAPTLPPTPTLPATVTSAPTVPPTATPTSTPSPTEVPTRTPVPTPTPTATEPPTLTPTSRPAATATPRPTATPPLRYPPPTLLLPLAEATLAEAGHFAWQWDGPPLGEDLFFDLRIWSEREDKAGWEPRGAVELTKGTEVDVLLEFAPAMEFGEGLYYWTVVVVRAANPPQVVGEWGEKRWFKYYLPTPTPTSTPKPTATPVPPTNTPRPRPRPTMPRPTPTSSQPPNTPAPQYELRLVDQRGWPNCGSTGVKVYFKQSNGSIYPGVQFALYAGGCVGVSNRANLADGSTDFQIWPNGARPGTWEVQAVETSDGSTGAAGCGKIVKVLSPVVQFQTTDKPCEPDSSGVQWMHLTFQEN